jgi:isoleucyl-tRNA synthetase
MAVYRETGPKTAVNDRENAILQYWQENDIVMKSMRIREGKPKWVFYEGPPTANGRPGIHHVLARTLKDIACRYKTMQGYEVKRKGGWDTHGLPVEIEVEKKLGLSSKREVEDYGIEPFNEECRKSVFAYEKEWRSLTERIAYWIDMDNPYVTLHNDYIESVWWLLKQYFDKGYIYEGHRIMPYCPRCGTPLASHEVAQGYKDETIDSIYVRLKVKGEDNTYLLVWTTTPWTLPNNVAAAVSPESTYVKARLDDEIYYLAKERVEAVLGEDARILQEFSGSTMEYLEYEPIWNFGTLDKKSHYVTLADYVSTGDGTGIVHISPAFGEDDFQVGQKYELPMLQLVDREGKFTEEARLWAGRFVKEADPDIIKELSRMGALFKKARMTHSYPHCWRCDTPLLYYARKSWFIATTKYKDKLIEANKKIRWVPEHVGSGRFGNWLENLVDWSLSRDRYWGTPLNIWKCEECNKLTAIGSRQELAEKAIESVDSETVELHRPYVDDIHLRCSCGGTMTRTPEVIDCWFDSGSMPYAQWHYPFEHKEEFDDLFPADFICEGLDQTRGWFYSLLAISTFISGEPAYKEVLVNDLILDKDGLKMSKSRGNTVDPWSIIDKFGVDALRWYLMSVSPPWVPTRFDIDGVREVYARFFGTLQNVYSFFVMYANIDGINPMEIDVPLAERPEIDRWVISRLNSLLKPIEEDMKNWELTRVVRAISEFVVEDVSNWYVRRSRERFWATEMDNDKKAAYRTLYEVLLTVAKIMAPIAPFISEDMYLNLTQGKVTESVHFELYPVADESVIDKNLEERMGAVITVVSLGRAARNKVQIKVRQPLAKMLVRKAVKPLIESMETLVKEELNVKEIEYVDDLGDFVTYEVKPNFPVAGPKYGKLLPKISKALSREDARSLASTLASSGRVTLIIDDTEINLIPDDVEVRIQAKEGFAVDVAGADFVVLDTEIGRDLILEGIAREIVSKVQNTRKSSGFNVLDRITMKIHADSDVEEALKKHHDYVTGDTLCDSLEFVSKETADTGSYQRWDINGHETLILVERVKSQP